MVVDDYHVVDTGDIVYTKSPLKSNPFGIIRLNNGAPGVVSTLYAVYEVKDGHSPSFWGRYFELDDRTNRYLMPLVHKGAKNDMKINNDRVLIDPVYMPELTEQERIAELFAVLDKRIELIQRRRAGLTAYKKSMVERIFSQTLRFVSASGSPFPDWQTKRLGDVAAFSKGKAISKSDISEEGQTPCIRYGELYTVFEERIEAAVSATDLPIHELTFSKAGDVILPASGETPLDMASAACVLTAGIAIGGDINIIRSSVDGLFLAYTLRHAKRREIAKLAQGNSVVHLYPSSLAHLKIDLPGLEEQKQVAHFLASIDAKIDVVSRQVESMQIFKRGLLQQMFV